MKDFVVLQRTAWELSKHWACCVRAGVLAKYSRDLTELAREGKLDPVVGRHGEMRRLIDVLGRRTKNRSVHSSDTMHGTRLRWQLGHALKVAATRPDQLLCACVPFSVLCH
jgi:hypothetical protein